MSGGRRPGLLMVTDDVDTVAQRLIREHYFTPHHKV
jgi:hypothetical protein